MVSRANSFLGPSVNDGLDTELLNKIVASQTGEEMGKASTRTIQWPNPKVANQEVKSISQWLGSYSNNIAIRIQISNREGPLIFKTKIADFQMLPQTDKHMLGRRP